MHARGTGLKIAVIADAHGNQHGFRAALEAVERHNPDEIVAAGDMLSPYFGGPDILTELTDRGIHCLRDNGDDRLVGWFRANATSAIRTSPQFRPLQKCGQSYSASDMDQISNWPLTLSFSNGGGSDVVVCHGTPKSNSHSIADFRLEPQCTHLRDTSADAVVAGHYHYQWTGEAEGTLLSLVGSCGLPCAGVTDAQYGIVGIGADEVSVEHHSVPYDLGRLVAELRSSDYSREAGPVGWLMLAQTLVARPVMLNYFRERFDPSRGTDIDYLETSIKDHLFQQDALGPVEETFGPLFA